MNLPLMKQRSENCTLLKELGLAWILTHKCKEEVLAECLYYLRNHGCAEYLKGVSEAIQEEAFQSLDSLRYILNLLKNDVQFDRIGKLLEQVDLADLMASYSQESVETVLKDNLISAEYLKIYLDYFYDKNLSEEEKQILEVGLIYFGEKKQALGEEWIRQHGMFLLDEAVASMFLYKLKDYDKCLEWYAVSREYREVLGFVKSRIEQSVCLDDENAQELYEHGAEIQGLLCELERHFDTSQMEKFCELWLDNHALLYDLQYLKEYLEKNPGVNVEDFLAGRASYIAFLYNENFSETLNDSEEKLVIYAAANKKHAFLKLIRENVAVFKRIPSSSILFHRTFYTKCVNINTLNLKNLKTCIDMTGNSSEVLAILAKEERTFDEVALLFGLPKRYALLYEKISAARKDDKLRIMREIVKRMCVSEDIDLEQAAEQLSIKPLSHWMQEDFKHIGELNTEMAMNLLGEYNKVKLFIPQISNAAEVRYILNNPEKIAECSTMREIRKNVLNGDLEWKKLVEMFGYTEEFVEQNEERIREFIFADGAHITSLFLKGNPRKEEELRRLVTAELLGKFRELKYHGNDLQRELDYPLTENQKQKWMKNRTETEGRFHVWEEDGFIPVMKMGEIPFRTCISYVDGIYSQCLIANHDSNKKVLYLAYDGKIVLRAALRLTKGTYQYTERGITEPELQFVYLSAQEDPQSQIEQKNKEKLVLFLENEYVAGLPERMRKTAFRLLLSLLRKKAAELGALLVISSAYSGYVSDEFIFAHFFMYISKSKAGEQYLDSLGGSNRVGREGSYTGGRFLIDNK